MPTVFAFLFPNFFVWITLRIDRRFGIVFSFFHLMIFSGNVYQNLSIFCLLLPQQFYSSLLWINIQRRPEMTQTNNSQFTKFFFNFKYSQTHKLLQLICCYSMLMGCKAHFSSLIDGILENPQLLIWNLFACLQWKNWFFPRFLLIPHNIEFFFIMKSHAITFLSKKTNCETKTKMKTQNKIQKNNNNLFVEPITDDRLSQLLNINYSERNERQRFFYSRQTRIILLFLFWCDMRRILRCCACMFTQAYT